MDKIDEVHKMLEAQFQRVFKDGLDKSVRIAELEKQLQDHSAQAFSIGETYANALTRIAELEAQVAELRKNTIPEDCVVVPKVSTSPGNCKWADRREQRLNQRTCHYLEKDGLRMTVRDWAKHLDLHESVLHYRLRIGLPTEKVLMPKRETQKTWSSRPTALQLREVFDYDPETGIITRKNSDLCRLNKEGDAGHVDVKGYLAITTGPYRFAGHRVAWALFYGEWPKKALKHINRDKLDNRIANLREATWHMTEL